MAENVLEIVKMTRSCERFVEIAQKCGEAQHPQPLPLRGLCAGRGLLGYYPKLASTQSS